MQPAMRDALLGMGVLFSFASFLGLLPVVGPGRAASLGLFARAPPAAPPLVGRGAELRQLRAALGGAAASGAPLVVTGPRGVGKTHLLDAALHGGGGGVAVLALPAGAGELATGWAACKAVTRHNLCGMEEGSARRVLWWHRWLFGVPFTVVLRAPAAASSEDAAALRRLHGALLSSASALASASSDLRVVVDATDFQPEPLRHSALLPAAPSVRCGWLVVQPLPRAALEAAPALAALLGALQAEGAAEATWEALGGEPAAYLLLNAQWRAGGQGRVAALAAALAQERVAVAMDRVSIALGRHASVGRLLQDCGSGQAVPASRLGELRLLSGQVDGVLRAVVVPGAAPGSLPQRLLLPVDAATALVLSKGLVAEGCEAAGQTVRVAGW
jgi:hypothetical protein